MQVTFLRALALFALAVSVLCARAVHAEVDLTKLAEKGCASARSLRTIDCQFQCEIGYYHHYVHDADKYRIEYWKKGTFDQPDQRPHMVMAFDGEKHYLMRAGRFITGGKPHQRPIPIESNPVFVMYRWLFFAGGDHTWRSARDINEWSRVLGKAQVLGDEVAAGVPCCKVAIDFGKGRVIVWFAVELGCVPVQWTSDLRETNEHLSSAVVLRYKTIDTAAGRIALPLQTRWEQAGGGAARKLEHRGVIDEQTLRVNQPVEPELFTLVAPTKPMPPLAQQIPLVCRDAALSAMRALIVLAGDDSKSTDKLTSLLLDTRESREVLPYRVISISPERQKDQQETINNRNWPKPDAGEVVLVVLDEKQTVVESTKLKTDQVDVSLAEGRQFLGAHRLAQRDAVAMVAAAQEQARASGRRIWLVSSGPRCGTCFLLARWMDDQKELLEKDYVLVKVMGSVDKNSDVVDRLMPGSRPHGIPYHAILEPDGTVLITSMGPRGNIGMPSGVERIGHLRQMVEQTAKRISAEEIAALEQSLTAK